MKQNELQTCPICGKRVKPSGLKGHMRFAHEKNPNPATRQQPQSSGFQQYAQGKSRNEQLKQEILDGVQKNTRPLADQVMELKRGFEEVKGGMREHMQGKSGSSNEQYDQLRQEIQEVQKSIRPLAGQTIELKRDLDEVYKKGVREGATAKIVEDKIFKKLDETAKKLDAPLGSERKRYVEGWHEIAHNAGYHRPDDETIYVGW